MSIENRVELIEGKETKVKFYIVFAINAIYIITNSNICLILLVFA